MRLPPGLGLGQGTRAGRTGGVLVYVEDANRRAVTQSQGPRLAEHDLRGGAAQTLAGKGRRAARPETDPRRTAKERAFPRAGLKGPSAKARSAWPPFAHSENGKPRLQESDLTRSELLIVNR